MIQPKVVEKIKTHILYSGTFFLFENRVVYENNMEKYGTDGQATDGNIIWRMRLACRVPKAKNKQSRNIYLLLFHYKNGCNNASQCYVIVHCLSFS